jgi:hypothetical protein
VDAAVDAAVGCVFVVVGVEERRTGGAVAF